MIRSGWANNCGIELFTHGWVQCPDDDQKELHPHVRFHQQAMREDEEMLLLFASFIEVISCRH